MSKLADSLSGHLSSGLTFIKRIWIWGRENQAACAIVLSVLGIVLSFWGFARAMNWGAAQLGPLSSYLAAVATLTAVTVALRQSWQARKIADEAVEAARIRAEIDRDFNHRRETTKQILEMWVQIAKVEIALLHYIAKYRTTTQPTATEYVALLAVIADAKSTIFSAETVTLKPPVIAELKLLSDRFEQFEKSLRSPRTKSSNDEYSDHVMDSWSEVSSKRGNFPKLLREHLPLLEGAEREGNRISQMQEEILAKFGAGQGVETVDLGTSKAATP